MSRHLSDTLLVGLLLVAQPGCGRKTTSFQGTVGEIAPSNSSPVGEAVDCAEGIRPTRIAFIVDNSGSHAAPGGTDPVRSSDASARGQVEDHTYRQNAIFTAIDTIWGKETVQKEKKGSYTGSDVSLAFFPRMGSNTEYQKLNLVSGEVDDAATATKFSSITYDAAAKQKVWDSLDFTHSPSGMTPYKAVLDAALELLPDDAADKRPREVFLITDGLPTDSSPKAVMSASQSLVSKGIRVTTIYIFNPSKADHVVSVFGPRKPTLQRIETTDAYKVLQDSFRTGWGQEDRYKSFAAYWKALTKIPKDKSKGGISTFYIPLETSKVETQIVDLLGRIAYCTP
jgi:hypothetical protein